MNLYIIAIQKESTHQSIEIYFFHFSNTDFKETNFNLKNMKK
jgi:hypothetical protein